MIRSAGFNNGSKPQTRGAGLLVFALMILTLMVTAALIPTGALAAKGDAKIDELSISVQPEYDDPRVLAVFQATLSNDTELPREAEFLIPKSANDIQIGMACEVPEGQGHRCKVYDTKDAGDFESLTYKVDSARNLFLEYYWDPFKGNKEGNDGKKGFVYEYKAPYPIKSLQINVQKPLKASEFKVEPNTENITKDEEGFEYYAYNFDDVKKDQVFTINADYVKTDPGVSKPKQAPGPVANTGGGLGEASQNQGLVRLMIFLFILLFAGGIVGVYWRSQLVSAPAAPAPKPKKSAGPKKAKPTASTADGGGKVPKFCANCGTGLEGEHNFCPECGDEL